MVLQLSSLGRNTRLWRIESVSFVQNLCSHTPNCGSGELEAMLKAQSTTGTEPANETSMDSADTSLVSEPSLSVSMSELSEDDLSQYLPTISESLLNSQMQPPSHALISTQSLPLPNQHLQQLVWADWPPRLPPPDLMHHLVEMFFGCYAHAHYLLHRPSFMASLALSPKSPKFPHVSLLHAICAYASMFSYLVDSPPMPNLDKTRGDVIFGDRRNVGGSTMETFADRHARWSKETRDEATALGFNLLECTQCRLHYIYYGMLTV
jgi:hypothetical protein